jgi:signal transduction histidine kinase
VKILFVEDNPDDVALLVRELRKGGFAPTWEQVDTAEALRAAVARGPWDVVLSDYAMPRFTGLAALRLLQDLGADTPFVLISGTVGEEIAVEAMRAGASDYLLKGNLTRLVPAVRRELRENHERRRRRQAERALQESRELVQLIYDHTSDRLLLLALDPEYGHRIASINRAAVDEARRLRPGIAATDLRGRDFAEVLAELGQVPAAQVRELVNHVDEVARRRVPMTFETTFERGGTSSHFEHTLVPVANDGGITRHVLVAIRDVSERRRAEDAHQRIESQVVEAHKLEALGRLASGIAHDFNNVLSAIISHAAMVRIGLGADDPLRAHVDDILIGAHQAAALVKQILAYGRRQPVARKAVALAEAVTEALRLVRASVPPLVKLEVDLAPDTPAVLADGGQLHQVVMNLATNALQSLRGAGQVTVRTRMVELDAQAVAAHPPLRPGRHAELVVEDTGEGVPAESLAHIFEPFYTTRASGGGTGLGLAVVKAVVQGHGGAVAVSSTPGRGTRFCVWLAAHEGRESEGEDERSLPRGHGERVVVVDDDPGLAKVAAALIEHLGYRAAWYADAAEALGVLEADHGAAQVVLCDLSMPGLTGEQFARRLRARAPEIKLVLTTGYGGAIDADAFRALGFSELLPKPYAPDELASTLARVLAAPA